MTTLARRWFDALRAIVERTSSSSVGGRTPSDIALVRLDQAELDEFEVEFDELQE